MASHDPPLSCGWRVRGWSLVCCCLQTQRLWPSATLWLETLPPQPCRLAGMKGPYLAFFLISPCPPLQLRNSSALAVQYSLHLDSPQRGRSAVTGLEEGPAFCRHWPLDRRAPDAFLLCSSGAANLNGQPPFNCVPFQGSIEPGDAGPLNPAPPCDHAPLHPQASSVPSLCPSPLTMLVSSTLTVCTSD